MTSSDRDGAGILGTLRAVDGQGVVRLVERFDNGIEDVWSALTRRGLA